MKRIATLLLCFFTLQMMAKNKITYLKIERTPCFGKCPSYTVEFLKTGAIIYTGKKNTEMLGTYRSKMSKIELNKFFKQFENYGYNRLSPKYDVLSSDLPGLNITLIVNGKRKSVKHAEAGPRFLTQIGADVDELVLNLKWLDEDGNPPAQPQIIQNMDDPNFIYEFAEQMPEFMGGEAALRNYLNSNINYPKLAKENKIEGKVICKFVVDPAGNILNANVIKGIGYDCDQEALRVVQAMPKWTAGKQNGRAVNVSVVLPIFFKLSAMNNK